MLVDCCVFKFLRHSVNEKLAFDGVFRVKRPFSKWKDTENAVVLECGRGLIKLTCFKLIFIHIKDSKTVLKTWCDQRGTQKLNGSSGLITHIFFFQPGTNQYMPPEFIKTRKYDGCQGTVWQMGILLVDMLSPLVTAFEKPHHALSMAPRVPQQFSPGI